MTDQHATMAHRRYPDTSSIRTHAIKSSFMGHGVACAATLHLPMDGRDAPRPAILMVGGWGSVQQALTSSYVNRFVEAGWAVMEFDFPTWGHSAGWPRQEINPWMRVRVADAALAHLRSLPQVDANQVVLWGTSFGGGHVVDLATQHPELLGAIIQVPMLDGLAAVRAVPLPRLLQFMAYGLADLFKPGARIYLPTLSKPGELGTMDRDKAWEALELALAALGKKYDNRVSARSVLTMAPYRPWTRLKQVGVPMLIMGATADTVAPFVSGKVHRVNNPHLQVIEIAADHFDPYFDPVFPQMIERQLAFLRTLLPHQ
ncbi:MAG: alpha/beta hydrolase [Burkholderiales bacterium]|nr:alpha/beta hydrolase [Burkholderiales bacterium]